MENAFQTYSLLKGEVKRWQDERGSFWIERLNPVKTPPYYPVKELPEQAVFELCKKLNHVSNAVVPDAALSETWNKWKDFEHVTNTELLSRLQIALSGVAELFQIHCQVHDNEVTTTIVCPICGELAGVSILSSPHGKRYLHCSMCGHEWLAKRVVCVRCGSEEASKLNYLHSEEYPGVEMIVCQACGQYFKEFDFRVMNVEDIDWDNIRTLPLDYAAEKWLGEKAISTGKVQ